MKRQMKVKITAMRHHAVGEADYRLQANLTWAGVRDEVGKRDPPAVTCQTSKYE